MSNPPLAQILGEEQTRAVHEALKPHLRAVGVRHVEGRIGKPRRFFENVRQRGSFRLQDYLATCAALEIDPVELVKTALDDRTAQDVRPPRIVTAAWKRLRDDGPGLGEERMAELDAAVQAEPRKTRAVLTRELPSASRGELPRLLGLCASAYRVESDLPRAELVLRQAREIGRALGLREAEPELLIRMAYVALERERLHHGLRWAQEGTLGHARLLDTEGQGRGFLTMGMLRFYANEHGDALSDLKAAMALLTDPRQLLATHQIAALCYAELGVGGEVLRELSEARTLANAAPEWMHGKMAWLEAKLVHGAPRIELLQQAKTALCSSRPSDCALVTVELIEEALLLDDEKLAEQETLGLLALMKHDLGYRVESAIVRLVRNRGKLTPSLVTRIRRSLDRGRIHRLSTLIAAGI